MMLRKFAATGRSGAHESYRPDIDGLRAIAVTSVLLYHTGVPGFPGGYVGVDVFFVISGYLITGRLASDIAAGQMSISGFYERRIRRIMPALLAMTIFTWIAAAVLMLPFYLLETSRATVAAAASVSNLYLWRTANYFGGEATFQPLLHTWSLSVEEQFYLFIPVLMVLTNKVLRGRWVLLFAPMCLTSFALSVYATDTTATANFYLLPTRAWELGLGALVATTSISPITRRLTAELAGVAALLLLYVPVMTFSDVTPFPGLNALYPCLGSALLIHIGRTARPAATALLCTRPFVAIGLISYSLYLVHWPIISLMRYRAIGTLDPTQIVVVLVASLMLAVLSWRFIERPFRRLTPRITQRRTFQMSAGAIVFTCLIGLIGIYERGFPGRFRDFAEQVIPGHDEWKPDRCFLLTDADPRRWSMPECTRIASGPLKVLLWGDSYSAHYIPGMVSNAAEVGATVIQFTAAGCLPILKSRIYSQRRCREFEDKALEIVSTQKIDVVVMAGSWSGMPESGFSEIAATLTTFGNNGVSTVLIGQSPRFAMDVQSLSFLRGSKASDAVNRWTPFLPAGINDFLAEAGVGHHFINPMPALCSSGLCTYQDHGSYLFEDSGHYSVVGSDRVVRELLRGGITRLVSEASIPE